MPVQEKFVKVAIAKTTWARPVCARTILNVLNAMDLTLPLFELNIPVVKLPPSVSAPAVNV